MKFTFVLAAAAALRIRHKQECGGEGQPACTLSTCGGEGQPACSLSTCGGEGQPACSFAQKF